MRTDHRVLATILLAAGLVGIGLIPSCQETSKKDEGGAPAVTAPAPGTQNNQANPGGQASPGAQGGGATGAQGTTPSSGRAEVAAKEATGKVDDVIVGSTRRDARGLPEPLPGYQSWLELGGAASPPAGASPPAHLPIHRTYILTPKPENFKPGLPLSVPALKETVVVREAKKAGDNFISRLEVMKKGEGGWEYSAYERATGGEPFKESASDKAQCAACHAKEKEGDSLHSRTLLKE